MLKIISSFVAMILVLTLFTSCGSSYRTISQAEAQKILAGKKDYILLDVRTLEEYEKKHIPNAVLLPLDEIKKGNVSALPDKKQKILVYCRTGRRSEEAAKLLAEMGYSNVINFGGLIDWTGEVEGSEVN